MESESHDSIHALPVPLTLPGTVAFSRRSAAWLLLVWLLLAGLASATCLWFIHSRWIPVAEESIESFPTTLLLENGEVDPLPTSEPIQHQNGFLSIVATGSTQSHGNLTADFQITITPNELRFHSLLGHLALPYPAETMIDLAPAFLKPWWKARKVPYTVVAFGTIMICLLVTWIGLASLYFFPIIVLAYFRDRRCQFWKTWRLGGSVLIPGALIMTLAILLYGFHLLNLLGLLVAAALHIVVPWLYVFGTIKHIPRVNAILPRGKNPFSDGESNDSNSPSSTNED